MQTELNDSNMKVRNLETVVENSSLDIANLKLQLAEAINNINKLLNTFVAT